MGKDLSRYHKKATEAQVIEALERFDGNRGLAAAFLGMTERAIYARLRKMKQNGNHPDAVYEETPAGHAVAGVSTLVGADGEVRAQWVKTRKESEDRQAVIDATKEAFASAVPVARVRAPRKAASEYLAAYPMGDPHVGMYAWAEEAGADFDLEIAEANLIAATSRLIESCRPCEQALIVNLGDFFHADTKENKTLRSGNVLDVDTRWGKVLRTGIRIMRTCIEKALERHKRVHVINAIGNHDEHTSQMLTIALAMYYEKNPRVTFEEAPTHYHYHQFGNTLIGVTHGDQTKVANLPGIMATDRPKQWGDSKHRYWFTGHVHNQRVFEFPGCLVESFRTLAARDAWHSASGYRSGRDMQAITFHKEFGEVERHRMDISVL